MPTLTRDQDEHLVSPLPRAPATLPGVAPAPSGTLPTAAQPRAGRRGPTGYQRWRWWCIALRGVAAVIFGLLALNAPAVAVLSLVLVFGIYAIVDGALALSLAIRGTGESQGDIIARGLVSILAGGIALAWPGITLFALLFVIAAWAVVGGILEIVTAIRHRQQLTREWLLVVEGALSIAFGVILFLAPLAGAIVLGLWVGAYALVFGVLMIAAGLRVRSRTHRGEAVVWGAPVPA
jgi:uncharacterized membrane protein HdeD (DUF308 family)